MARKIHQLLLLLSALTTASFVGLLIWRNLPGLPNAGWLVTLGVGYVVLFLGTCTRLFVVVRERSNVKVFRFSSFILVGFSAGLLVYIVLNSILYDYYQPISLYDDVIISWAISWSLLILSLVTFLFLNDATQRARLALMGVVLTAVAAVPVAKLAKLTISIAPTDLVSVHRDVFVGGESGIDTYRIPALLVIPAGSQLASGEHVSRDQFLAFAEARHDSALDTGAIDLVLKRSIDDGLTWSESQLVCRYQKSGMTGKCGNPTPVFDHTTGIIHLAYNTSGIPKAVHNRGHKAHILQSRDGGVTWGDSRLIAEDNLVFGPGHGIQKRHAPFIDRLLIPAYTDHATVLYSDNHGNDWQRSSGLNTGNESELVELHSGDLYLTTRHRAPIGRPPLPGGRLYAMSKDAGTSWLDTRKSVV